MLGRIKVKLTFFGKQFNLLEVILMYIFLRTSRKDYSLGIYAINTPITFSETTHIGVLSTFLISNFNKIKIISIFLTHTNLAVSSFL